MVAGKKTLKPAFEQPLQFSHSEGMNSPQQSNHRTVSHPHNRLTVGS